LTPGRRLETARIAVPGLLPSAGPGTAIAHVPLICARVARASEEEMRNIDPVDPAVRTELRGATIDLRDIAVTVDRASAVLDPTVELLEASVNGIRVAEGQLVLSVAANSAAGPE